VNRVDSHSGQEFSCHAYKSIATAFTDGGVDGADQLTAVIEQHREALLEHGNLGLAELVQDAFPVRRLINASRTYATISLEGLARSMGAPYQDNVNLTEIVLVAEIEKGTIRATIDKRADMVTFFSDDMQQQESGAVAQALVMHLQQAMATSTVLRSMHGDILSKRAFLSRAMASMQSSQSNSSVAAGSEGFAEVYLE
jgi:hypothetical protein